jgi:hypothetical protein
VKPLRSLAECLSHEYFLVDKSRYQSADRVLLGKERVYESQRTLGVSEGADLEFLDSRTRIVCFKHVENAPEYLRVL